MFEWMDVTDTFSEERRHWNGRYMEMCEVASDESYAIECSLFSYDDGDWEIYVNYGIMFGVSYVPAQRAREVRRQMMKEIEEEFRKNRMEISDSFINTFARKYHLDYMSALFG